MSNKTPRAEDVKTELAPKFKLFSFRSLFYFGLIVTTWLVGLYLYTFDKPETFISEQPQNIRLTRCLRVDVGGETCHAILEVADDNTERMKGLSGRESMDYGSGMLFEDAMEQFQCFWMKDMKFALDILWLDDEKKVVKAEYNVSPDTYPQQFCADNTRYVIELSAGRAHQLSLGVGSKLDF